MPSPHIVIKFHKKRIKCDNGYDNAKIQKIILNMTDMGRHFMIME